MSRWIPALLLAGLTILGAQQKQGPQLEQRTPPKSSGKQEVPPEEDKSFLKEEHDFNPLQSQKNIEVGDQYLKKGKIQAAANRYLNATMWNESNGEAWLKLAKANEKLRDIKGAKEAYAKYLELSPDAKDAPAIRKKLASLK